MATWIIKGGGKFAGRDVAWDTTVDDNGETIVSPTLEAGQTPTSWTKGTASTGTAVKAAHTIETNDKVDVYWADGIRYRMDATVSGSSIALAGGAGDDLPDTDTAVILCVQVPFTLAFAGDNLSAMIGSATERSLVCLLDTGGTADNAKAFEITPTSGLSWCKEGGLANPLDSFVVASGVISTTDPISSLTEKPVTFGVLYDSTPNYPG
jgi:hypothetical protein